MKKTFKQLVELDTMVAGLYKKYPDLRKTKFGYAYTKFYDQNYAPTIKKYLDELKNIRIDHALEDEKTKEILEDNTSTRGFKYSKQGLKDVMLAEQEITNKYESTEIDIKPFISVYVPEGLIEEETELLTGCVI